jgi:hypothetical protein
VTITAQVTVTLRLTPNRQTGDYIWQLKFPAGGDKVS